MSKTLTDLVTVLAGARPELADALSLPASESDIAKLEEAVGVSLPPAFVAALKAGNGQQGDLPGIFKGYVFLSCNKIVSTWRMWNELLAGGDFDGAESAPDSGIKPDWWHPGWIPLAGNGSGDYFCLDMAPTSAGLEGQVICVWHDMATRQRVSDSFAAWVTTLCSTQGEQS